MGFEAKINCDASGCSNDKGLNAYPEDLEFVINSTVFPEGRWLHDPENDMYYCPLHAMECAKELELEYAK